MKDPALYKFQTPLWRGLGGMKSSLDVKTFSPKLAIQETTKKATPKSFFGAILKFVVDYSHLTFDPNAYISSSRGKLP
jgi:hypothetical protein